MAIGIITVESAINTLAILRPIVPALRHNSLDPPDRGSRRRPIKIVHPQQRPNAHPRAFRQGVNRQPLRGSEIADALKGMLYAHGA